jgi:hypothetical protein
MTLIKSFGDINQNTLQKATFTCINIWLGCKQIFLILSLLPNSKQLCTPPSVGNE